MTLELRDYQSEDVERVLSKAPVRWLLEHDTGLGKTVIAIEAMKRHPRNQKIMIVCGNSLLLKWRKELSVWWPDSPPVRVVSPELTGTRRQRENSIMEYLELSSGVLITNYNSVSSYFSDFPLVLTLDWFVLDEAHHIKNRQIDLAKRLHRYIFAENRLLLTATPTDGNPADYWSLLRLLFPNQYTSYWKFANNYCKFFDNGFSEFAYAGPKNQKALKAELADKIIRRDKRKVLLDLPPVTSETINLTMTLKQAKAYEALKSKGMVKTSRELIIADNPLTKRVRLRQLTSTPQLLGIDELGPKIDYVKSVVAEAHYPVVIYTCFAETVQHLQPLLAELTPCETITGSVPDRYRQLTCDKINRGELKCVIITEAGGEGLDLWGADHFIFMDLPLSQIKYRQAIGRIDRIGQQRPVLFTTLVVDGSVDERVLELITSKTEYTDQMIELLLDNSI